MGGKHVSSRARTSSDGRTIALVGLAHGTSHFFHMLLPPLFPVFVLEFGVSYAELGLAVTLFFVISGIGQALAGFVVDRVGARPVLYAALLCFVAAGLAASGASGLDGLLLAAVLAGLGNSPFHPVDFAILNQRVSAPRLGHAFSVHGVSGNLGWAAAPLFQQLVIEATGSWRYAMLGCALWALTMLALLILMRHAIDDGTPADTQRSKLRADEHATFGFLRLPSVWLCFSFFFFSTSALAAILSYASPALSRIYGIPVEMTAYVVSGYMVAGACGMVLGGFLVGRSDRLERTIGLCMSATALMLALVGSGWLPPQGALIATVLAGVGYGLAGPSRDMLIKRAAPPGATGRVYGTVYSGLDIGFAVAAPVFGALLDRGLASSVFHGAALALGLGVASASLIGLRIASGARAAA